MKKSIIFIFFLICFGVNSVFANQEKPEITQTYESYQSNTKSQCDASSRPWGENNSLVPIPQYPKLQADAVNRIIEQFSSQDGLSDDEKKRLSQELTATRIGEFQDFKTLEVARLQYRATMNSVFSCAIVESRLNILKNLRENINKTFPDRNSEILVHLKKEEDRLENKKNELKCNSAGTKKIPIMRELVNTSTRQYCHYRYYLSYLESRLEKGRYDIEQIEKNIGTGNGTKIVGTTDEWIESYNRYSSALQKEIDRADATLPRAIVAYKEMEKAYPIHLMLVIIYDDYIRLRENLSTYMNASTQLYLKAFNAQDANKR